MAITFKTGIAAYAVGRRVNMEEWNAQTFTKDGEGELAFGVPVVPGTIAGTCVAVSAAAQNVLGISEASATTGHPGDAYRQYDNVSAIEAGVIGVRLGANVSKGAQARFDVTAGNWTGGTASATVLTIPGAQFDEDGASGSVGVVRYRRPVPSLSAGA